jgi:hypothetical protein
MPDVVHPSIDVAGIYDEAERRGILVRWDTWSCKLGEVVELHFPRPRNTKGDRFNAILRVSHAAQDILYYSAWVPAGSDFPQWDDGRWSTNGMRLTTDVLRAIEWIMRDYYPDGWGNK